jgi:hypothetical protein
MTAEEQALFGIDRLNVLRSEIPALTHVLCAHPFTSRPTRASNPLVRTAPPYWSIPASTYAESRSCAHAKKAIRCFAGTELDVFADSSLKVSTGMRSSLIEPARFQGAALETAGGRVLPHPVTSSFTTSFAQSHAWAITVGKFYPGPYQNFFDFG